MMIGPLGWEPIIQTAIVLVASMSLVALVLSGEEKDGK